MTGKRPLTATSFAILGLLALRPWRSYDLAKQLRRSQGHIWPRAESNVYAESKRLVRSGHALATVEKAGKRRRTVYAITSLGRKSLRAWLHEPTGDAHFASEGLLKVYFGDLGSKAELLATIAAIGHAAEQRKDLLRLIADEYRAGAGPFPERRHVGVLALNLVWDQLDATITWSRRARAEVQRWPATAHSARSWPPAAPTDFQQAFLPRNASRQRRAK